MSRRVRDMRLARARAARMEISAAPDAAAKFAEKAHDLDALKKSVEDVASFTRGLWLSYLFALFYIGIAAGGVTHEDLLLENPVKLPFLNVELPLVAFFFLAPILFVSTHAYTLVHIVLLAGKIGVFDTELRAQLGDAGTREGLRWQLPTNNFVQLSAGPRDVRGGVIRRFMQVTTWGSLVIGPVLLLLLLQVQFLPYHLEWVTWVQRLAILADVILLWLLWPAVLESRSTITWPQFATYPFRYGVAVMASLVPIGLSFTAATFPGECADDWIPKHAWIPPNPVTAWLGQKDQRGQVIWTSFHDLLFNGKIDEISRRRKSPFSNTLVLPYFDGLAAGRIDDEKKLDGVKLTLVLRARHLEGAVFDRADLRKADLDGAHLQGSSLTRAKFQGASFREARLQGASLYAAELQGASLDKAQLQGAWLVVAQLQGASLALAALQGASLEQAQLQGASLDGAQLQGASLDGAQLQGASLDDAELQGAHLAGTRLQGASLLRAGLQGATLESPAIEATALTGAYLWRVSFDATPFKTIEASNLIWDQRHRENIRFDTDVAWTAETYGKLRQMITEQVPVGFARDKALERIEVLDPGKAFEFEAGVPERKQKLAAASVGERAFEDALALVLDQLVCPGGTDALHVLRGLFANGRIEGFGNDVHKPIDIFLARSCSVSASLTDADRATMRRIAGKASAGPSSDARR